MGNRLQQIDSGNVTTYQYNSANQLLLVIPPTGQPTTSSYDNNGNLILENAGGALTTYTWDYENRLTGVAYPNGTITTNVYSDDSKRQQKITSAGTTNFVWDGPNILQEWNGSGALIAQYTNSPGTWDFKVGQTRSGVNQYFGADAMQNIRLVMDANANVLDDNIYGPFGVLITTPTQVNPFLFDGNQNVYFDGVSFWFLAWNRWVRVDLGRFPSVDPLWPATGPNGYPYGINNPLKWTDPSGLVCTDDNDALCRKKCSDTGQQYWDCDEVISDFFGIEIITVDCQCTHNKCRFLGDGGQLGHMCAGTHLCTYWCVGAAGTGYVGRVFLDSQPCFGDFVGWLVQNPSTLIWAILQYP